MDAVPTLVGTAGHVAGEVLPLEYGKKVTVGRSRAADWSLVRMRSWTGKSPEEQADDDAFRTVSGKHFEITMYNLGSIELVNLSSNGTKLDGNPVDRATITDLATNAHEISFGVDEVLGLQMRPPPAEGEKPEDEKPEDEKPEDEKPEAKAEGDEEQK